jgi:hypothetical protein
LVKKSPTPTVTVARGPGSKRRPRRSSRSESQLDRFHALCEAHSPVSGRDLRDLFNRARAETVAMLSGEVCAFLGPPSHNEAGVDWA